MDEDSKEKFKFKEKHEKEKIKEEIRKEIAHESVKESEMAEKESLKESLQVSFPDSSVIMSADKSVSTYGMPDLADYQRAVTYDIVFNSLLEKKMQAMKRDCEERKRAKRLKRKSIGRIFFAKRLFSSMDSRKTSSFSETNIAEELHARTEPSTPQKAMKSLTKTANRAKIQQRSKSQDIEVDTHSLKSSSQRSYKSRTRSKSNTASSESPKPATSSSSAAAPAAAALAQNDDSVTSTLSNSSDKVVKRNLLVQAQTHTPNDVHINSSSSGDSKYAQNPSNGISAALPPLSIDYTQDTTSLASGYENGTGARIHSSTMADDSLTSIRDSIESLSFNSSRCTVSFGATEVIPQELDHNMYERLKAAKRQRILEAKSISAQCSPILPPRHVIKTMVHAPMSPPITKISAQPAVNIIEPIITSTATTTSTTATSTSPGELQFTTRPRFLPNQYSYTDSIFESRNISRQNTSEDSANLTVSTLLNQSDSLSLNAPLQNFLPAEVKFTGKQVSINDRFKSKSTSLLVGNGRTRPPPLPPPPFETVQNSPSDKHSPTATTATLQTQALPLEQLQQLHITSNIRYNKYPQQQEEKSVMNQNLKLTSSSAAAAIKPSLAISSTSTKATPSQPSLSSSPPPSLHIVTVTSTSTSLPHQYPVIDTADMTTTNTTTTTTTMDASLPAPSYYLSSVSPSTLRNGTLVNGAIVASSSVPSDTAKLHRMTSTSTGSSIAPTGCCTTTKSSSRLKEKQRFKPAVALGQSGSDDEYRKKKRKYKRYHRCSDPVLVYPTPSGLQHCILSMPPNDPIQYPYTEDYPYDMQLQIESDKNDDLEKIVPSDSTKRRHHKHRHHRHKKRHRHKKPKILVHDLETQEVKVIDPDDLPQRARWTIIATACLLLLMCLMLVGITLRMAPIIDDMDIKYAFSQSMIEGANYSHLAEQFSQTMLETKCSYLSDSAMGQQNFNPNERFPCKVCGKSYLRKRHLQRHMRDECIGIPPRFSCEHCPSRFRRKYHMVRHLISKHNVPPAEAQQATGNSHRNGGVSGLVKNNTANGEMPENLTVTNVALMRDHCDDNGGLPENLTMRKENYEHEHLPPHLHHYHHHHHLNLAGGGGGAEGGGGVGNNGDASPSHITSDDSGSDCNGGGTAGTSPIPPNHIMPMPTYGLTGAITAISAAAAHVEEKDAKILLEAAAAAAQQAAANNNYANQIPPHHPHNQHHNEDNENISNNTDIKHTQNLSLAGSSVITSNSYRDALQIIFAHSYLKKWFLKYGF